MSDGDRILEGFRPVQNLGGSGTCAHLQPLTVVSRIGVTHFGTYRDSIPVDLGVLVFEMTQERRVEVRTSGVAARTAAGVFTRDHMEDAAPRLDFFGLGDLLKTLVGSQAGPVLPVLDDPCQVERRIPTRVK